ncbi:MAG: hypothetical protein DRR19_17245 [Candidatus Parabeggiatoa sp. nov. 1]|nr:MAG: hypothetical protein DRR19_17245 [Gammaproteobacteria bacterium]
MKKLLRIIGTAISVTVGTIYFVGYCYVEKNCPFITADSLEFEVIYQYYHPCLHEEFGVFKKGDLLRSEGYYQIWFTAYQKNNFLTRLLPHQENKYVYIFQINNGERIVRLFPNQSNLKNYKGHNAVQINVPYYLPAQQLDNNIGDKNIYYLTFTKPNGNIETLYENIINGQKWPVKMVNTDKLQLELIRRVKALWQQKQDKLLKTAVPMMHFKHREKPLCFDIKYIYRSADANYFQTLRHHSVLYSGDQYKIQFTAAQDSYIYLFQQTTTIHQQKQIYRLFPCFGNKKRDYFNTNPVRANVTYYLPEKGKHWTLDNQKGLEKIYFLAFATHTERGPQYKKIDQCDQAQFGAKHLPFDGEKIVPNERTFKRVLTFKHEDN